MGFEKQGRAGPIDPCRHHGVEPPAYQLDGGPYWLVWLNLTFHLCHVVVMPTPFHGVVTSQGCVMLSKKGSDRWDLAGMQHSVSPYSALGLSFPYL